ncbi:hypothetical protein G7070_02245 [Propioniciclava coleopterorum]|uniref:Inner membrane protein n=1 Tax=Propioniciclava coleopterorum TaxID=2714937 RepID=A0A6G7Y3N8_9ACTN|nr:hypothetical protein [Propioniciclava coleopterorum]QIK71319.1 hypothetical protein G7070_02245 [Propioniciclava coleopterorum]
MIWYDVIGYAGAAFIVTSLAMRSRVKMRWLGIIGALLLAVYGVLIAAWPVTIANLVYAVISVTQLRRDLGAGTAFSAVPLDPGSPFLADYLGGNAGEIANSQPEYHPSPHDTFIRLVNRDGLPAGILIGEPAGNELLIKLDYVTPAYRDSTQARWLFGPGRTVFTEAGFTRLVANAHTSVHRNYLELLGFHPEGNAYVLDL